MSHPLKGKKYSIAIIDPPWFYHSDSPTKTNMASRHYNLMSDEEIKSIPIKTILNKNAFVFVWATCPKLDLAIEAIKSWGLHYRGVAHVWVKTNKQGKIIHAQGVPPTYSKPTTELLLVATTTKKGRPISLLNSAIPQVVLESRQPMGHSAKPKIFHQLIEKALGKENNKIEIFAREAYQDWDVIGNEMDKEDIISVINSMAT